MAILPDDLHRVGVRWQVRRDLLATGTHVDLAIDCAGAGRYVKLMLSIGSEALGSRTTKRALLESLITQCQQQLAVEALEDR